MDNSEIMFNAQFFGYCANYVVVIMLVYATKKWHINAGSS
jgi:hypothetical protein